MNAEIEKALAMLSGDMDSLEGKSAMAHSLDDCPDPLGCDMHESENAEPLADKGLTIEIKGAGMPTLDGAKAPESEGMGEGLSDEEAEALKKLLK